MPHRPLMCGLFVFEGFTMFPSLLFPSLLFPRLLFPDSVLVPVIVSLDPGGVFRRTDTCRVFRRLST